MVRIVDGEIVQDDDPRLQRPQQGQRAPAATGPAAAPPQAATGAAAGLFDFSAPPLRVVPDADGTGLGGLPSLVVFGAVLRPQHLLMVAAAAMFLGWRGLMVGAILCEWMAGGAAGDARPACCTGCCTGPALAALHSAAHPSFLVA